MRQPQITQEQIDAFLTALDALEPAQEGSVADQFFDAVSDSIKAKLAAGLPAAQILDLFKAQGIQLGTKRVAKFVRSLAPKKRKRSRTRRAAVQTAVAPKPTPGSPAAVTPTPEPPTPPQVKPTVEPTKPPQGGPLVGTTAGSRPGAVPSTKRRSNASLGDHY